MAVRIRLKRMGRKKAPHYRVVVADSRSPRDGRFVESLGYYKPLSNPARLVLDLERVDFWLGEGASPSNTVKTLISRARTGGDETVAVGEIDVEAEKKKAQEELQARRAAEKKAEAEAEAAAKAEAEAAAKAKAEAEAAAKAEAEAAAEAEAESDDAASDESGDTAEAESAEEPAAEADEAASDDAAADEADAEESDKDA
ncbi:MAG: 30S ribosomal protein S16 [Gemmatimonadetes bacterium]|nr:30S ribosomal protein S16 [Gemmatimonadota bacterium]